jgi:hypothetical protein
VKPGILEKGILLKLRFYFDQYVNLRPVKLYEGVDTPLKEKGPDDIDFGALWMKLQYKNRLIPEKVWNGVSDMLLNIAEKETREKS